MLLGETGSSVRRSYLREAIRQRIAFCASTPAYRPVLEHHGIGDLQTEGNRLSKQDEWEAMGGLTEDDVLRPLAVVEEPGQLPQVLAAVRAATGSDTTGGMVATIRRSS
jgi:hypothetical protein